MVPFALLACGDCLGVVPENRWTAIGTSGWDWATIDMNPGEAMCAPGTNAATSAQGFGIIVSGQSSAASYAYPGGLGPRGDQSAVALPVAKQDSKKELAEVEAFIEAVANDTRRDDARTLLKLMRRVTRQSPKMWGKSLVGFGNYFYRYESGREGEYFITGFSPRKANLVVYIMPGFEGAASLMAKLGKHKTGVSCLYINKLADVDLDVLTQLIRESVAEMKRRYPTGAAAKRALAASQAKKASRKRGGKKEAASKKKAGKKNVTKKKAGKKKSGKRKVARKKPAKKNVTKKPRRAKRSVRKSARRTR